MEREQRYARVIWETSRNDEGTISATGANAVARAVMATADEELAELRDRIEFIESEWEHDKDGRAEWFHKWEGAWAEALALRAALGFERGWSDAATRALAEARAMTPREPRKPRSLRVEDDLWDAALKKADERGEVLSEEIRKFLQRYIKR